jgi:hypothetical protein
MGHLISLELDAIADACRSQLEQVAESIAKDARRGYQQHELKTANPRTGVIVESDSEGVRVVTHNSFAHFDEWGGSKVRSQPTGAMRTAAMRHGEFHPEGA